MSYPISLHPVCYGIEILQLHSMPKQLTPAETMVLDYKGIWLRRADWCFAGTPHEQTMLTRTLGRHCHILAFCVLNCQPNDYLEAQVKDNFYHANSATVCTGCSKGNNLLDTWFGAILKQTIWRPASQSILSQFQGHLLCVPEGCSGQLY